MALMKSMSTAAAPPPALQLFFPSSPAVNRRCLSLSSFPKRRRRTPRLWCTASGGMKEKDKQAGARQPPDVDCVGTGSDVECFLPPESVRLESKADDRLLSAKNSASFDIRSVSDGAIEDDLVQKVLNWGLLISPFFFWGTAMVAMKEVIPKTGPFFVSAFRLMPAGLLLIGFAAVKGRKQPSGFLAWLSIVLFGVVDAACFQVRKID